MSSANKQLKTDEHGFASIVIALTLVILLALLTVGFAQLARREQQTALNKQLANQAFYAAESGVNDAIQDINSGKITLANADPKNCMPFGGLNKVTGIVNGTNGTSYTCLRVSLYNPSLDYTDTTPADGQYLPFSTDNALDTLTIRWQSFDGQNKFKLGHPDSAEFTNKTTWGNSPPVLQFSLTLSQPDTNVSRQYMLDHTFTVYLYPSNEAAGFSVASNSTQVAWDLTNQGQVVPGYCGHDTDPTTCSVTITGIGHPLGGESYIMSYLPYYDAANVHITGTNYTGSASFLGQAVIDVTGKAHNVLKRVQERFDADGQNGTITAAKLLPTQSIQAQDICKRAQVLPSNIDNSHYLSITGTAVDPASTDPCDASLNR